MTETHEQRVERLARAAYEGATRWCVENDHDETAPYEGHIADFCRAIARAIIASDREAEAARLREAVTWLLNCHRGLNRHGHGVGGDGYWSNIAAATAFAREALAAHEPK